MSNEAGVFISYRRNPSKWLARLIFTDLTAHSYDVFLDVESLGPGRFAEVILHQVAARPHFVLILERGSLERCANPEDWLRREIEQALDTNRNIVPVTVENFSWTEERQYLTGKLEQLSAYQSLPLDYLFFDEAMTRLRTVFLRQPARSISTPAPAADQPLVSQAVQSAALSFTPTGYHATVRVPALNVRFGPGMQYPQVAVLREGTPAEILGRNHNNTWWYVRYLDRQGWVTNHFVEVPASADLSQIPVQD